MSREQIVHELCLPPGHSESDLLLAAARRAGLPAASLTRADLRILRQSLDARHKGNIHWQYSVAVYPESLHLAGVRTRLPATGMLQPVPLAPVVIGSGPAGLFAALLLALAGHKPLLLERGRCLEDRVRDVARFWREGRLDPESNVQFGEGGAGTFSDGKLTSGIKDSRCRAILEELVLAGAPDEILFLARPHIGTDRLRVVLAGLRRKILAAGGRIRYSCHLDDLLIRDGQVCGLVCTTRDASGQVRTEELAAKAVILAAGHSAREVFRCLQRLQVPLAAKPFSLGVRIEHPQSLLDRSQYGRLAGHADLPPAEYKLACHLDSGRSVYTFCMCPGGQVIAASSETGGLVVNGMSPHDRAGRNGNSAILVGVTPADFPGTDALAGLRWQQELEKRAFHIAGARYRAPAQRVGDFLKQAPDNARRSAEPVIPTCQPGVTWCDLTDCLPDFVAASLRQALPLLDRRLNGFAAADAVLTGVETRSSSPVRILRDERCQAGISGLYPAGEGSGYAGGIISAAADGLRCAESLLGI